MVTKLKKSASEKTGGAHLGGAVKDSAQQIWLAGLGAFAKAQEEGGKVFEALVKEGLSIQRKTQSAAEEKITEATSKMAAMANDISSKATGQWDKLENIFEDRVAKALNKLGVPSAKDVNALIARIDERGGAVESIEFMRDEIGDAAYRWHKALENGDRKVVGINVHQEPEDTTIDILKIDPAVERAQVARLADLRATRDEAEVSAALDAIRNTARGTDNLLPPMHRALGAKATIGEVCNVLRDEFGEYDRMLAGSH